MIIATKKIVNMMRVCRNCIFLQNKSYEFAYLKERNLKIFVGGSCRGGSV